MTRDAPPRGSFETNFVPLAACGFMAISASQTVLVVVAVLISASAAAPPSRPTWQGPKNSTTVLAHGHFHSAGVVSSAAKCEALCHADSNCTGWTWQDESHQTCKRGVDPEQETLCQLVTGVDPDPTPCPGHVSGWLGIPPRVPVPNTRQLEFMDLELTQFMHFGIPTFWDPPPSYMYGSNPTYHDCHTTSIDHGPQTEGYYPCLKPDVFNPTDLDAENWMEASANMGMKEIIITAHHEGGFALWPSKFTPYSVAASKWKDGKGDVLREFADAANKWGIRIGYYLNVQDDGYMNLVANYSCTEFVRRQVGMVHEVLTEYGKFCDATLLPSDPSILIRVPMRIATLLPSIHSILIRASMPRPSQSVLV